MNGIHDMGGMDGFGKVEPEENEPVFHAPWEGARDGRDAARWARSGAGTSTRAATASSCCRRISISRSYYHRWLRAPRTGAGQVRLRRCRRDRCRPCRCGPARRRRAANSPWPISAASPARGYVLPRDQRRRTSAVGDRVRARNIHPKGHTRLPRYVRGHVGVVERLHGCHVFPDSAAMGAGR